MYVCLCGCSSVCLCKYTHLSQYKRQTHPLWQDDSYTLYADELYTTPSVNQSLNFLSVPLQILIRSFNKHRSYSSHLTVRDVQHYRSSGYTFLFSPTLIYCRVLLIIFFFFYTFLSDSPLINVFSSLTLSCLLYLPFTSPC